MPQVLWREAGSPVALGCPRTHTGLHVAEVPLQTLPGHRHLPNFTPWQPPQASAGLNLSEIARKLDAVWSPTMPTNWPPLTWHTFISISDAPLGGSICWVLVMCSPNSSSVPVCPAMAFMAGYRISALESPKHGYFTHCLSKLLCLHLLTLDLNVPFFSSAPVPNPCRI